MMRVLTGGLKPGVSSQGLCRSGEAAVRVKTQARLSAGCKPIFICRLCDLERGLKSLSQIQL